MTRAITEADLIGSADRQCCPPSRTYAHDKAKLSSQAPIEVEVSPGESLSNWAVPVARKNDLDTRGNRVKACFLTIENDDNLDIIRSAHPSLRECVDVKCVKEPAGRCFWMVGFDDAERLRHTHAGGWEIHVEPQFALPKQGSLGLLPAVRENPLRYRLDPRRFVSDADLRTIQEFFPGSIGIHVLVIGYIVVLFAHVDAVQACFANGLVEEIGGLRMVFGVASYFSTAVYSRYAITDGPAKTHRTTCLGLRLRLVDGTDCITTTTHVFVKLKRGKQSHLQCRCLSWLGAIKNALRIIRPQRMIRGTATIITSGHAKTKKNSSLNKSCYLANSTTKVSFYSILHMVISRQHDKILWN